MNARDIVEGALRAIGVISRGYSLTGDEGADGLESLNSMLESWSGEGIMIPSRTWESFSLTINQTLYTWGSGGNFDSATPIEVQEAYLADSEGTSTEVTIIDAGSWGRISDKDVAGRPSEMYVQYSEPVNVRFDFAPNEAYAFSVASLKRLTTFTNLDTDESVPNEYRDPMKWNLAIRLAPEYSIPAPAIVMLLADQTKRVVMARNLSQRMPISPIDDGLVSRGGWDIYSGDYNA